MNPPADAWPHEELELLAAFKEQLNRHPERTVSPFSDGIVRYATNVAPYDVEAVHGEARECIRKAVAGIHGGNRSQVVILAGEAGIGKSHLINYFRQPKVADELNYVLVGNSNHWKVDEFEERLLDWVLAALTGPGDSESDLLHQRVQAIAFAALGRLLKEPGQLERHLDQNRGIWNKWFGNNHATLEQAATKRDVGIFRQLQFEQFARYVCKHFLAEPSQPFHRYVMHVLLRCLFSEEREKVHHWLRGKTVDGHFLRKLGVEDTIDRKYKAVDTLQILISLFTPETTRALGLNPGKARVFFLAFDQVEGRDELFESDEDWKKFFAQLSELYCTLPNVFILFTMTLGKRNQLHARMEAQFRDRIRNDSRFTLHPVTDADVLALYQQRLRGWLQDRPELLARLQGLPNPYLPFLQEKVLAMGGNIRLRQMLRNFDDQFRLVIEELRVGPQLDFAVSLKEIRRGEEGVSNFRYAEEHLETVCHVLNVLGPQLAVAHGIRFDSIDERQTETRRRPALQLQLCDPREPRRWVRIFLVLLPQRFTRRLEQSFQLLHGRQRDRYHLWLVRHGEFAISDELLATREGQVTPGNSSEEVDCTVPPELESALRALARIGERLDDYGPIDSPDRAKGERFLLDKLQQTYLNQLFLRAKAMLRNHLEPAEVSADEAELQPLAHPADLADEDDDEPTAQ